MKLIVIGGGCFGTTQARRLIAAMERGIIGMSEVVVVDRNSDPPARAALEGESRVTFVKSGWFDYLDGYFGLQPGTTGDQLIPAHIAPHLLLEVAMSRIRRETGRSVALEPVRETFKLPFEKEGDNGVKYISAAAWLCPFACIEPEVCPAIRGRRDWDLSSLVPSVMGGVTDMTVVFKTTHFAWGVGTIPCDLIASSYGSVVKMLRSDERRSYSVAVATTSNCHGVVGMLRIM